MRPTFKAVFFFSLSVPLALLIVSAWSDAWYLSLFLPVTVLALTAADAVSTFPARRLSSVLRAPKYLYAGQAGVVELDFADKKYINEQDTNQNGLLLQVLLEVTGEADTPGTVSRTMRGGRLSLALTIVPRRRGQVTADALWLSWRGPLGLVETISRRPDGSVIDVAPDVN